MKKNLEFKFVLSLIFAVLVAIFAIQNAVTVEINFLFARFTISQALIILISAIVGAIVVLLISLMNQMSQRKKNKELIKEVEDLKKEIEDMKNSTDGFNQENQNLDSQVAGPDISYPVASNNANENISEDYQNIDNEEIDLE